MLAERGLKVVRHEAEYQVDGEVGRFRFGTFDVTKPNGQVVFSGTSLLPPRQGRQWYQTWGFKELGLLLGATQRSYRKTTDYLNRHRRQEVDGTPLNTLRDAAEAEGNAVLEYLEQESSRQLKRHGFAEDGRPLPKANVPEELELPCVSPEEVQEAWCEVKAEMQRLEMSPEQIREAAKHRKADYEDPDENVNVYVDDVGVKEQKEERRREESSGAISASASGKDGEDGSPPVEGKRPMAYNTVARIEHAGQGFTLTGRSVLGVLRYVLAFLLRNDLLSTGWLFFTDGQRSLQNAILALFAWHPRLSLILDWFHLVKKCREELSLALKGREIRNRHLKQIVRLLWFGLVTQAVEYVRKIPDKDVKNRSVLERLVGYFERNRGSIPCYAMRRRLGLPNSSNPAERMNNLVTSNRQKKNGMSWSEAGSQGLTALTAVHVNRQTTIWIKQRKIPFVFSCAA